MTLKSPDPLSLKIAKKVLVSVKTVLQIGRFLEDVSNWDIFEQALENNPDEFRSNHGSKDVAMRIF